MLLDCILIILLNLQQRVVNEARLHAVQNSRTERIRPFYLTLTLFKLFKFKFLIFVKIFVTHSIHCLKVILLLVFPYGLCPVITPFFIILHVHFLSAQYISMLVESQALHVLCIPCVQLVSLISVFSFYAGFFFL